jgi:hypothetical protein
MHVYIDTCMDIANAMVFMYVPGVFWLVQSFPLRYIQALMKIQDLLRTSPTQTRNDKQGIGQPKIPCICLKEVGTLVYIYIVAYIRIIYCSSPSCDKTALG